MRMTDELQLIDVVTTASSVGIPVLTETSRTVYAEKESVKRSEFYAANSSGARADIVFVINEDEYNDEMLVKYNAVYYKVVRAYAKRGRVELTCALR